MANAPDAAEPGSPRLAMLETIREFGLARLAASDESEAVHRAHAEYFLVFARQQALAVSRRTASRHWPVWTRSTTTCARR